MEQLPPRRVEEEGVNVSTEPFVGYRCWDIMEFDRELRLGSVVKEQVWLPGVPIKAICYSNDDYRYYDRRVGKYVVGRFQHEAPDSWHLCGIYGHKTWEHFYYRNNWRDSYVAAQRVWGAVYLWGKVIETEYGYRAEYGYPKELWIPTVIVNGNRKFSYRRDYEPVDLLRALQVYGVPVSFREQDPRKIPVSIEIERAVGLI